MNKKVEQLLKKQGANYIFPFFWQHGEEEDVLRTYMKVIDQSNIKAVCVESRPHPDFCGDKWWKDMDVILDEARKRNMKVWILDDSHFPTGFANGAMDNQPDELCRQSVCCRIYETAGNECVHIDAKEILHPDAFEKTMIENYILEKEPRQFDDDRLLSIFAVKVDEKRCEFQEKESRVDLKPYLENDELTWKVPEGEWKIYVLHLSRNHGYHRSYINMMNRTSCKVLLDAVYEPHFEHYKDDFGTTIEGFFSDEPELGNGHMYDMDDAFGKMIDYPWSDELEERLRTKWGTEFEFMLGLLWETGAEPELTAKARYAYMDAVTELVKEDFSNQMGTWCRERGVKYIGHLIEDDNHHARTGSSLGHFFRGLAGQDMSGIDDIGGQVFPQGEDISYNEGLFQHRNGEFYHYLLGKLGSSAAAIEPLKKGDSMCEIFGNYGWAEGVRLEKYLADHFLVRGINHYVPHAFSAKEFPDPDCPPHFYAHGHNPQYRHFGYLMSYMNRVCELISHGRHSAPVAVLYHGEGDWTGAHMTSDKIGHILADTQIEYDVIPQDVFAKPYEYQMEIAEGMLKVNTQEYKTLVVPYMQYVTKAFANAVNELENKGVQVLFVQAYPEGICDTTFGAHETDEKLILELNSVSKVIELETLPAVLKEMGAWEFALEPANNRIRYIHYMHTDGTSVLMFVNEGTEIYKGSVCLREKMAEDFKGKTLYMYDAWDNVLEPAVFNLERLQLEIEPLQSRIFILDASGSQAEIEPLQTRKIYELEAEKELVTFDGVWKRSLCESIKYQEFGQAKEIGLPDALAEEEPEFSGFVRYENEFTARKDDRMYLEITDAYEGVEVFVNEVSQGIQIVPVYRFDISSAVKDGKNQVRIEVATTLERATAKIPNQIGQTKEANSKSGITGEVRLWNVK